MQRTAACALALAATVMMLLVACMPVQADSPSSILSIARRVETTIVEPASSSHADPRAATDVATPPVTTILSPPRAAIYLSYPPALLQEPRTRARSSIPSRNGDRNSSTLIVVDGARGVGGDRPPLGPGGGQTDEQDSDEVPFWPNFFAKFMAASYLVLMVLAGIQLARTIIHKHKIKSFRFGFLLVCWLWTLLRCVFWFIVTLQTWPTWLSHLIYFLPNACQIGTFSLLILFYAKLVHRHRWRVLRVRFLSFCILSNTAMVFLTLTFSILMDRVQKAQQEADDAGDDTSDAANVREFVNKMYFMSCAVFFGVLVVLAAYYIHRLRTARRSTAGTSRQEVLVTSMIFVIFLSRCIWDMLAAFDATSATFRQGLWETPTRHIKLMATETFCLLFVWEIIPTLMVIVYFRNIPNTTDSYCVGAWSCFSSCGPLRSLLEGWPCRLPAEYFEVSDSSRLDGEGGGVSPGLLLPNGSMSSSDEHSIGGGGGGGGASLGGGMRGSMSTTAGGMYSDGSPEAPPYHTMGHHGDDAGTGSGSSSILPPGSFVPSSSMYSQQAYAAAAGVGNGPPAGFGRPGGGGGGAGMQIGGGGGVSARQQPNGLGLPPHMGAGGVPDLYGSPTWLNVHHPALVHLTPSPNIASAAATQQAYAPHHASSHNQHYYSQQQQQQHGGATQSYYEDEADFPSAYGNGIHPYTQQQQQQQGVHATSQHPYSASARPPLHAQRSRH